MFRSKPYFFFKLLCFVLLTLLVSGAGCNGNKKLKLVNDQTKQMIIKFSPNYSKADINEILASLEENLGVVFNYIRPMSGDAHVIKITYSSSETSLEKILQQINDFKGVEYAEEDKKIRIQVR